MQKNVSTLSIWTALITLYIVWGSTYLAIRFGVETLPPFLLAAARFLVAGAILYLWRRAAGDKRPTALNWRSAAIVGGFLLVGGNGGVTWAEQRVVSGVAALMVGLVPLWMLLMDAFLPGGKSPGYQGIIGVVLGLAGIVVLVGPSNLLGFNHNIDMVGILALCLATFLWAAGSLYSRTAPLPESPLMGTAMEMLAGGGGLLLLATLTGEWGRLDLAAVAPRSLWGLIYLITFGSLVGYASYTWLLRVAPTPLVSTYAYVNPLIAILVGNLLAQEPLTPRIVLSALVIVGSVILINTVRSHNMKGALSASAVPCEQPGSTD
jgi:drug/metabolite transporter (DMT)-like permease